MMDILAKHMGTILLCVQLIAGELIFLYSADKRKNFAIRLPLASIAYIVVACRIPRLSTFHYHQLYQFAWIMLIFAGSVAVMGFSFRIRWWPLFSLCVAGYAVQHLSFHVCNMIGHTQVFADMQPGLLNRAMRTEAAFMPWIYLIMFLTFGLFCARNECWKKMDMRFGAVSIPTIFICIGLTRLTRYLGEFNYISVSIYAVICCLFALVVQLVLFKVVDLKNENAMIQALWKEDRRQFELSKKTIDVINIKSHDLKHKLAGLKGRLPKEEIDSIDEAVRIYDSTYKTGNDALDVLLTENSLHCQTENILMTFTGNGKDLAFMNEMDVYSLFGNAISNAVEAARLVEDPEKRLVDIVVESRGKLVNISVSNYFNGEVRVVDGLPETTKKEEQGYHGFGMKSRRLLAEKYGGGISVDVKEDLFCLGVYLFAR